MVTNIILSTTANTYDSSSSAKTLTIQHKQKNITFNFSWQLDITFYVNTGI